MAGITKLYLTAEQQEELRTWIHHHAFRIMLLTFKNPYRYLYSIPDEAYKDERYTRKKYPATNFPEKIDKYLMRYCKLPFIREGLKRQYNGFKKLLGKNNTTVAPFSRKTKREIQKIILELEDVLLFETRYNNETSLTEIDNDQFKKIQDKIEELKNPWHDNRDGELHIFSWDKIKEIGSKYDVFDKYINNHHSLYIYDNPFSEKPDEILFSYFSSYDMYSLFCGDKIEFKYFEKMTGNIYFELDKAENREIKEIYEFIEKCRENALFGIYEIWT